MDQTPSSSDHEQEALDSDYEEETFYVTVDLGPNAPKLSDVREFSLIGINESPNPILRVGGHFYQGKWAESLGTDIFIERVGEVGTIVETTRHRLVMEPVRIEPKEPMFSASAPKRTKKLSRKRKSNEIVDTSITGVPDEMMSTWNWMYSMSNTTIFEPHSYGENAKSPFGDSKWIPMLFHTSCYPVDVFDRVIDLLLKHPERNSTNILRADIVTGAVHSKIQIDGWNVKKRIVRRLIPRNPIVDSPIDQTCTIFSKVGRDERLVILVPHGDYIPFYHPKVEGIAYLYTNTTISIHIHPREEITQKLERTCYQLLRILNKFCIGTQAGYVKKFHHDLLVPKEIYQDKYQQLKAKYGKELCLKWVEKTNPAKHVFEDLAIAAFLITLWGVTKPKWVDLGCGNGLLVHILQCEGYEGYGVDIRKRKSWDVFTGDHREHLVSPLEDSFAPGSFFIGNHADQLAPWIPLIASLCPNSQFMSIPCCAYSLDGSKFSAPLVGKSKYAAFTTWICSLAESAGWEVEKEYLRIPSTRNIAIIGRKRYKHVSRADLFSIINEQGGMVSG